MTAALGELGAGIEASGKSFENDQVVFAHFRDGLMVEVWKIADTGSPLRQVERTRDL